MKETYSIFKKYPTLEQAIELRDLLKENGIESLLADNIPSFDVTFSPNILKNEFEVRIRQTEFKKAEEILEKNAENFVDQIDNDYYLFGFTDEELYEILLKSDEWNVFDYTLAQKILKQRGKAIDKELLTSLKTERIKDLAKPEENQRSWIVAGYIFSILGGFLGLLIGYLLWTSKKTLPNGQKVYSYTVNDRKHGKYIFYTGLIIGSAALFLRLIEQF
ncbi:MAG: hypothetical protein R3C61_20880 [Bacteroidia bacterium]